MLSSASSDIKAFTRIIVLALIPAIIPLNAASGQLTSSRNVVILPFVASDPDSLFAGYLFESFMRSVRRPSTTSIVIQTDLQHDLKHEDIIAIASSTTSMGSYANRAGAAFLLCGAVKRLPEGGIQVSLVLYGTDDKRILATDMRVFPDEEEALSGIGEMALENTQISRFTPSDTSIMYSLIVPGAGQLTLGEPAHAIASVGLLLATVTLSPRSTPEDPPWRIKQLRKRRTLYIAMAWAINVLDTVILVRHKLGQVDARPFFSIVETAAEGRGTSYKPMIGVRLRW